MDEGKQRNKPEQQQKGGSYGKRPAWQWVLIYLVIAGLVYWFIYYLVTANSSGGGGGFYG